jgi:hypothetical protein
MTMAPCKRKTCPDAAISQDYAYCSALCRHVAIQVAKALAKGDKASQAELNALLGIVDATDLWRSAVMAENKRRNAGNRA